MYCNTSSGAHDAFAFPSSRATPVRRPVGQCGVVHKAVPGRPPKLDASDLANLVRRMRAKPGRRPAVPQVVETECDEDVTKCHAIAKVTEAPCKRPHKILIHGEKPIFLFRRIARIVAKMVAVCHTMKTYAVEAGLLDRYLVSVSMQAPRDRTKDNLETEKMAGTKAEESFVFDLDYFLMNKKNEMPTPVRQLMEINPDDRTDHDIELIGREVWKIPSFRKYSSRLQRMMCRIVRYMRCGKRRIVLRKGHIGFNVYFIYSGSVNVIMEKDDTGIFVKPEVVVLRKGACFGEIALLENTRRNATIVCAEPTELLVIDKDDYMRNGLSDQMKEETRLRFEFFRNWTPLAKWSESAIHALSYISRTEDFAYNRVIVEDSQRNEWLWFIAKGNGELLRFIDLEKCTDPKLLESLENKGFEFMTTVKPTQQRSLTSFKSTLSDVPKKTVATPDKSNMPYVSKNGNAIERGQVLSRQEPEQWQRSKWQGMPALLFGKSDRHRQAMVKKQQLAIRRKPENVDWTPEPQAKTEAPATAGKGIFLRVDKLVQGQCMGLEPLFPDMDVGRRYSQQRYSLVSQGCTIIHLPRVKFREMAPPETLHHIAMLLMEDYPHDSELGEKFISKSTWEIYKHGVVEAVVKRQCQSCPSIENYLRFDAVRDIDRIQYTPVDKKGWTHMTSQQWNPASGAKKEKPLKRPMTSSALQRTGACQDSQTGSLQSSTMIPAMIITALNERRRSSVIPPSDSLSHSLAGRERREIIRPHKEPIIAHKLSSRRSTTSADSKATAERPQPVHEIRHIRLSQIIDLQRVLERRHLANEFRRNRMQANTNVNYNSNRGLRVPKATFTTSPDEIHLPSTVQH